MHDLLTVITRIERLLGKKISSYRVANGGYTSALRLIIECDDGFSCFAKVAVGEITAEWLKQEYNVYRQLSGDFMARMIAWEAGTQNKSTQTDCGEQQSVVPKADANRWPILLLEDLSSGQWHTEWNQQSINRVVTMLSRVRQSPCPEGLPTLESQRSDLTSWHLVAHSPQEFLNLRVCSPQWLASSLPALIASENSANLDGSKLVHLDVRSDNLCFLPERVVLVDWNWSCTGNAAIDLVAWLPSVTCEGGPPPEATLAGEAELVSVMAGFWAYRAGQPPIEPDNGVRRIQLAQLKVALPWCARLLGLEPPDRDL